MKKNLTLLFATLFIASFSLNSLAAQEAAPQQKTIVVTIKSKNPDGSSNTTTMMKSGDAAKDFDVQKYIAEQKKDKPDATVEISDRLPTSGRTQRSNYNYYYNTSGNTNTITNCNTQTNTNTRTINTITVTRNNKDNQGFLGVSQVYSEDKVVEGVRVNITRNSGAAKAGLKDDDVILQLNKTPINSFSDVSKFMRTTKPNDKVEVLYDRDGATKTVTAVLGQQQDSWTQVVEQEKEACLGVYTSSQVVDAQRGAVINDFTTVSAAQESKMQVGDLITIVNGVRVKTHQDVWDEIAKYKPNTPVNVTFLREKETKQIRATLKACKPKDEKVIVVPKVDENTPKVAPSVNLGKLELESFAASPNPTRGMVNVSFKGAAVPTNLSFYDLTGKVLFEQKINDFDGEFSQRFDLNEYAKGVVVVKVQQGDKVFSKQIVVN
jgi:PDZ domain-containing secreted protein